MSSDPEQDDTDIYEDLPNFQFDEAFKKLEGERNDLQIKVESLSEQLEILKKENEKLLAKVKSLGKNISCLYKTAVRELQRKEDIITQLRRERDNLLFRRGMMQAEPVKTKRHGRKQLTPTKNVRNGKLKKHQEGEATDEEHSTPNLKGYKIPANAKKSNGEKKLTRGKLLVERACAANSSNVSSAKRKLSTTVEANACNDIVKQTGVNQRTKRSLLKTLNKSAGSITNQVVGNTEDNLPMDVGLITLTEDEDNEAITDKKVSTEKKPNVSTEVNDTIEKPSESSSVNRSTEVDNTLVNPSEGNSVNLSSEVTSTLNKPSESDPISVEIPKCLEKSVEGTSISEPQSCEEKSRNYAASIETLSENELNLTDFSAPAESNRSVSMPSKEKGTITPESTRCNLVKTPGKDKFSVFMCSEDCGFGQRRKVKRIIRSLPAKPCVIVPEQSTEEEENELPDPRLIARDTENNDEERVDKPVDPRLVVGVGRKSGVDGGGTVLGGSEIITEGRGLTPTIDRWRKPEVLELDVSSSKRSCYASDRPQVTQSIAGEKTEGRQSILSKESNSVLDRLTKRVESENVLCRITPLNDGTLKVGNGPQEERRSVDLDPERIGNEEWNSRSCGRKIEQSCKTSPRSHMPLSDNTNTSDADTGKIKNSGEAARTENESSEVHRTPQSRGTSSCSERESCIHYDRGVRHGENGKLSPESSSPSDTHLSCSRNSAKDDGQLSRRSWEREREDQLRSSSWDSNGRERYSDRDRRDSPHRDSERRERFSDRDRRVSPNSTVKSRERFSGRDRRDSWYRDCDRRERYSDRDRERGYRSQGSNRSRYLNPYHYRNRRNDRRREEDYGRERDRSRSPIRRSREYDGPRSPRRGFRERDASRSPRRGSRECGESRSPRRDPRECDGSRSPRRGSRDCDGSRSPRRGFRGFDVSKSPSRGSRECDGLNSPARGSRESEGSKRGMEENDRLLNPGRRSKECDGPRSPEKESRESDRLQERQKGRSNDRCSRESKSSQGNHLKDQQKNKEVVDVRWEPGEPDNQCINRDPNVSETLGRKNLSKTKKGGKKKKKVLYKDLDKPKNENSCNDIDFSGKTLDPRSKEVTSDGVTEDFSRAITPEWD